MMRCCGWEIEESRARCGRVLLARDHKTLFSVLPVSRWCPL